jgi:hypothetical protein
MTTQELVKWLLMVAANDAAHEYTNRADHMRLAADRLSEMDAENKRLKSEVEFLHLRRGQLVIERDKAREALNETIIDLNVYSDIGIIRARTIERRAALEQQQQKGEGL